MHHTLQHVARKRFRAMAVATAAILAIFASTSSTLSIAAETPVADTTGASHSSNALREAILRRDAALSAAYNDCKPGALKSIFAANAELYFAERGATSHVFEHIDQARRDVCGRFRREARTDAQQVYALPGHLGAIDGAIQVGTQSFCALDSVDCRGTTTRFMTVWRRIGNEWKIVRTIRYAYENAPSMPGESAYR
jgi:Domain of unknown function (DUF4440)